jgi:hypothetical protein
MYVCKIKRLKLTRKINIPFKILLLKFKKKQQQPLSESYYTNENPIILI